MRGTGKDGSPASITIGIPTYNRRDAAARRVSELLSAPLSPGVEVLVIDNASEDATYEALQTLVNGAPAYRVLRNDRNIGGLGNVAQLFYKCRTDYLLVVSDEDRVIPQSLESLRMFLSDARPSFVRCQVRNLRGGLRLAMDPRSKRAELIRPEDFYKTMNYISGMLYKVGTALPEVKKIEGRLSCDAAATYPWVLLSAVFCLHQTSYWYWSPVVEQKEDDYRARHADQDSGRSLHRTWQYLEPRWRQIKGTVDFLAELNSALVDPKSKSLCDRMLRAYEGTLLQQLRKAIAKERPDLLAPFDEQVMRAGRWKSRSRSIRSILKRHLWSLPNKLSRRIG